MQRKLERAYVRKRPGGASSIVLVRSPLMASPRTLRNITVTATVVALLIGSALILFDALRPVPRPLRTGGAITARRAIDLDALEAVVADEHFRGLVQLAPDLTTGQRGNSNPFAIFERR